MDFGKILSRAWHIIWNNKIIWLFGIFASFLGGPRWLRSLWPLALILLGIWLLTRGFLGSTHTTGTRPADVPPAPPTVDSPPVVSQSVDIPPAAGQDEPASTDLNEGER